MKTERLGAGMRYIFNENESKQLLNTGKFEIIDLGQTTFIEIVPFDIEELGRLRIVEVNLREQLGKSLDAQTKSRDQITKAQRGLETQATKIQELSQQLKKGKAQIREQHKTITRLKGRDEQFVEEVEQLELTVTNLKTRIVELEAELKGCSDALSAE